MRTIIYIDGFNLYFGCLRNTPYKWLDVSKLAKRLCHDQDPNTEILQIKYFTADIKAKLEKRGQASCQAQQDYLLALKAEAENIEVIKGKYLISGSSYCRYDEPVPFDDVVKVWRPEEKQTDVNIALHMMCDATDEKCQQMVLFSNDSDLAPALEMIRDRHPGITLGTITPIRNHSHEETRNPSADLKESSHWIRASIKEEEIASAQMPNAVITRKRKITKPEHW